MRKLLLLLLLPIFGCGNCDMTKAIDNTSKVVMTLRQGAKVVLDDRCLDIAKAKCAKAPKGQPLPACPELETCQGVRKQIYANASRIQIALATALDFVGVDDAKAKAIYDKARQALSELMQLMAKHKLVLEGVPLP